MEDGIGRSHGIGAKPLNGAYPPNSSSLPSPASATVTCGLQARAKKRVFTHPGSPSGSSLLENTSLTAFNIESWFIKKCCCFSIFRLSKTNLALSLSSKSFSPIETLKERISGCIL